MALTGLAEQEKTTFETQRTAEETRKSLQQARAQADTQAGVVAAERSVEIAEFNAKAVVKKAAGEAESKTINAKADAEVLTVVGNATAERTMAVGTAEASVIKLKTEAVGQNNYAVIEVGRALAEAKTPLVPHIMAGGGGADGGNSLVNILMAGLIKDGIKRE